MSKEPTRPSDSLVQQLLAERRELKVAVERLKLDLADAQVAGGGGPNPLAREVGELKDEVERLRYQLASARAEVDKAPDMREQKVADIKQKVSDGTYQVSAKALARKMLDASNNPV